MTKGHLSCRDTFSRVIDVSPEDRFYCRFYFQEYLGHLVQIEDRYRLCQALCDWSILDKLYHDEYSSQLLGYWRKVGLMLHTYMGPHIRIAHSLTPGDNCCVLGDLYETELRIILCKIFFGKLLDLLYIVISHIYWCIRVDICVFQTGVLY